jgi:hypothetical protein
MVLPSLPTCAHKKARWRVLALAVFALITLAGVRPLHAQELSIRHEPPHEGPAAQVPSSWGRDLGLGAAGAVSGFLLHESGHLLANLLLGNVPNVHGTRVWGALPFFVIRPRIDCTGDHCTKHNGHEFGPGQNGAFFIVTAGFHAQHATDEILLTRTPNLRQRDAPFQKGLLAFNVFLSVFYAAGTFTGLEDPYGDLGGAARRSGMHEAWLATVLAPAALDTYRYFVPCTRWAPWVSRASKASLFGLTFAF